MTFLKTHPARLYSLAVAVLGLVTAFGVHVPEAQVLGVVAAVLGLAGGEAVQRVEDAKTRDALLSPSPDGQADEG
ncbi:hypothetical protein JHN55_22815 [Streptomyces sp. MBT56]|uniref:hypothetical protein n=1 Tax=unclassified Streptomyces TaxID=2593676 RepID=UPI00190BDF8F|nr:MULTISPECIES: hypothetical protein [unclassified Streptomyces]MBK3559304.1 hypothetical protein [Streptomyces sp. MBT56]MBK3601027.1 hypothetical protein [Streptomyces sp. MBT54]MBK3613933.1 hypothetical protein [Streptomyces sp. MBT98]MBK6042002.1 hypothetical protein [Streptomyces sp. MBT55]